MTARARIVLVGGGSMGSLHARVIAASERADLVAVVDPRPDVGRALAERHGAAWWADLDGLATADVHGVVVAAATEAHRDITLEVIAAGIPVLVEKPVAASLEATEQVLDAARDAAVPLMCGLLERYNGAVMTARAMVREPVHVVTVRHSPYAPRILTGVSWDLLVHDVDIAINLIGSEPESVASSLGYFHPSSVPGAEDVVEATMRFAGGKIATASASRVAQRKVRSLTVFEVDRCLEVDLLRRDVTIYRHVANAAATDEGLGYRQQTIIEIPELVSAREPLAVQLDRFVDLIEGRVDVDAERESVRPAHRVVAALTAG